MKKKLLLIFAISAGLTNAQTQIGWNSVSKFQSTKPGIQKLDNGYIPTSAASSAAVPTIPQFFSSSSSLATRINIGSSPNLFGSIVGESTCLTANQDLNLVYFTHRVNSDEVVGSVNTGFIQGSISVNGGNSFIDTALTIMRDSSGAHLCRYPSGVIFNPHGNTNPLAAYAAVSGPWHPGQDWAGNYFGSSRLDGSYNNQVYQTSGVVHSDFARITYTSSDTAVYVMGGRYLNANGTTSITQGWKFGVMHKGVFNPATHKFTWTSREFPHAFRHASGSASPDSAKQVFTNSYNAWSQDGKVGYVVYIGQDSLHYATTKSWHPIVYKSIDYGTTWNLMPFFNFNNLSHLTDSLRATSSGTKRAFFSQGNGVDVIVDANYNLHILSNVQSAFSEHVDSLDFTWTLPRRVFDVYTSGTGWDAVYVADLMTDVVDAANSQFQASDGTGGNGWDARLQISRTQDGKRLFYAWMDTDPNIWGSSTTTNAFPDVFARGFNLENGKFTRTVNFTEDTINVNNPNNGKNFWMYLSNISLKQGTTYKLPVTVTDSRNGTNDALATVQHFYLNGITFDEADFNIPGIICAPYSATFTTTIDTCNVGSGSATATIVGNNYPPYSFSYDLNTADTLLTHANLHAGNHNVLITDANGCVTSSSVTVSEYGNAATLNAATTPTTNCNTNNGGAIVTGLPATFTYTYNWNTNPAQVGDTVTNLADSTYSVDVVSNLGCHKTFYVTIPSAAAPVVEIVGSNVSCNGLSDGTATATTTGGSGPFTYHWSNNQNSSIATGLSTGSYTITITDGAGCTTSSQILISEPASMSTFGSTLTQPTSGNNGTATVNAIGGTPPYTYSWNTTPAQTTATATGLNGETYTVTVTDAHSCTTTHTFNLGVGILDNNVNEVVSVYPNPTSGSIVLQMNDNKSKVTSVSIMDVEGRIVYTNNNVIANNKLSIDMSSFNNGIYILRVVSDKKVGTTKITKL